MKEYKDVMGSKESAKPLIIGVDTIYVHSNIKEIEVDMPNGLKETMYEYDEIQYDKDEYLLKLIIENNELKKNVKDTSTTLESIMVELIPNLSNEEGGE